MNRKVIAICFSCAFLLLGGTRGMACGDKVLALGRAIKLRYVSAHSASILLYQHAGAQSAAAMSDASLQSALKKSSKVLKVVHDPVELKEALQLGKHDLILADSSDVGAVEHQLQTTSSTAVIVPVLNEGTKQEGSALQKRYHVLLKTPGKTGSYFTALEEAMDLKARRDETKVVAKK
jgi:hypothetical protein